MIIPTKMIPTHKSLLYKGLILLNRKEIGYLRNQDIFIDVVEYFDTMTVLYSMGFLNEEEEVIYDLSSDD